MIHVDVEIEADEVLAMLNRVRGRVLDDPLARFLSNRPLNYMRSRIENRFAFEGDEVVGRWKPLRPNTRVIRARQGFGAAHPINVRTGGLYNFVRTAKVKGPMLTMPGRPPNQLEREKLRVAQMGGTGGRPLSSFVGPSNPAPPRPVLGLGDYDRKVIQTQLYQWVIKAGRP